MTIHVSRRHFLKIAGGAGLAIGLAPELASAATGPFAPNPFVRVAPEPKRKVHSGPEGLRMLVIGGCPGEPYKAPPTTELTAA